MEILFQGSPFYCELCEVKLGNIEECQNHATRKSHKKLKKVPTCYAAEEVS